MLGIYLVWFGYIARLSQRGGGGMLLEIISSCLHGAQKSGEGPGRHPLYGLPMRNLNRTGSPKRRRSMLMASETCKKSFDIYLENEFKTALFVIEVHNGCKQFRGLIVIVLHLEVEQEILS